MQICVSLIIAPVPPILNEKHFLKHIFSFLFFFWLCVLWRCFNYSFQVCGILCRTVVGCHSGQFQSAFPGSRHRRRHSGFPVQRRLPRLFQSKKKKKQPNPNVIFPFSPFYDFYFSFLFILPKVYQGSVPVHTSSIYNLHDSARHFTMSLGERGLALRGDILVKCYHRHRLPVDGRETIFSLQFHTCAVTQHTLVFQRQDLDDACQGPYQNKVVFLSFLLSLSLSRLLLPLFAFLFGPIVIEAHRRHGRQQTRIRMRWENQRNSPLKESNPNVHMKGSGHLPMMDEWDKTIVKKRKKAFFWNPVSPSPSSCPHHF